MKIMKKTFALAAAVSLVCLSSVGAMAANKLIVKGTDTTTDKFVVTSDGYVGIGNANAPVFPLHVVNGGDVNTTSLMFHNTGRPLASYTRWDSPGLNFMRNNDSSVNGGQLQANDRIGYFTFGSFINGAFRYLGNVQVYASANSTTTSAPTFMTFDTTSVGAIAAKERMRIAATGNIGIGTTAPRQKVEVSGGVRLNAILATDPKPTCDIANSWAASGTLWFTQGVGVKDTLEVCAKDGAGNYAWRQLY